MFADRVAVADPMLMTRDGPIRGNDTLVLAFHKQEPHVKPPTHDQIFAALSLINNSPVDDKDNIDVGEKLIQLGWTIEYLSGRKYGAPECPRCSLCEG